MIMQSNVEIITRALNKCAFVCVSSFFFSVSPSPLTCVLLLLCSVIKKIKCIKPPSGPETVHVKLSHFSRANYGTTSSFPPRITSPSYPYLITSM